METEVYKQFVDFVNGRELYKKFGVSDCGNFDTSLPNQNKRGRHRYFCSKWVRKDNLPLSLKKVTRESPGSPIEVYDAVPDFVLDNTLCDLNEAEEYDDELGYIDLTGTNSKGNRVIYFRFEEIEENYFPIIAGPHYDLGIDEGNILIKAGFAVVSA